ncbi:MAG TPA: peptidoglycan editing factor PgeF [Rhodocyclaceae bacterium]|nr:peptidoglycan editing factor PgeF [Rhodocyclaceae bacterium]
MLPDLIVPDWPAPPGVKALQTTRGGGVSAAPYASLNLGDHVGDEPAAVAANRRRLADCLPAEPLWLTQVHGVTVADAGSARPGTEADGVVARQAGRVCAVMTADCLPLLLCDRAGTTVAAVHAGWRGLAAGVIEATVAAMGCSSENLLAWLGPAIGPGAFEVGDEVRAAFTVSDPRAADAFAPGAPGKWLADIWLLARQRLAALGVDAVWGGGECTVADGERFFSYRRDGVTGRMGTFIWLAGDRS